MTDDIAEILVSAETIAERVRALGAEINALYGAEEELTIISIVNGAVVFTADLIRHLRMPLRLDCMRVSSYRDSSSPVQEPEVIDMIKLDLADRHVLIIDDILDTGHTFQKVLGEIRRLNPRSLRFGVLLEKTARRQVEAVPDFVGFSIPDKFVIGYGLDFAERYRNLPFIGVLTAHAQNPKTWA